MRNRPPRSASRMAGKTLGESHRGQEYQEKVPSGPNSATVCRSPIRPCSATGKYRVCDASPSPKDSSEARRPGVTSDAISQRPRRGLGHKHEFSRRCCAIEHFVGAARLGEWQALGDYRMDLVGLEPLEQRTEVLLEPVLMVDWELLDAVGEHSSAR